MDAENLKLRVEAALGLLYLENVRVRVEDDVVWLEGTVESSTQVDDAERRARGVQGVGQIVNDIEVEPQEMPLEDSAEVLESYEYDMPPMHATGDVMEAGAEAEPFAPSVDPVTRPSDKAEQGLAVTGGFAFSAMDDPIDPEDVPPELFSDGEMERQAILALQRDASTADLPIHVTVVDGVAHLRGRVRFLQDVEAAEEVVGRVPGIDEVQDELIVQGM